MTDRTLRSLRAWAAASVGAAVVRRVARRRYDFRDKTVLVTGGARGLGLLLAQRLLAEGARVAVCAREADSVARAVGELRTRAGEGARVHGVTCDVRDADAATRLVAEVRDTLGPVDVLVNNAGVIQAGPLEAMTDEDWREALDVHFWAALHLTRAVLPAMRERRAGRIVNIASFAGKVAVPHMLPYSASKFALVGLSDGLHVELAKDGVVVTTVCPGILRTGSHRNAFFKGDAEREYRLFALGAALPGLVSVNADRAARMVVEAVRRGDAQLLIGWQAKAGAVARVLAPELTQRALGLATRLLPMGTDTQCHRGHEVSEPRPEDAVTAPLERTADRNNEAPAPVLH